MKVISSINSYRKLKSTETVMSYCQKKIRVHVEQTKNV